MSETLGNTRRIRYVAHLLEAVTELIDDWMGRNLAELCCDGVEASELSVLAAFEHRPRIAEVIRADEDRLEVVYLVGERNRLCVPRLLAEMLGVETLALFPGKRLVGLAAHLDEARDARTEEPVELGLRDAAILDDVVKRTGGLHHLVEAVTSEDRDDACDVAHVRHRDAGVFPDLIFVPDARTIERALQKEGHDLGVTHPTGASNTPGASEILVCSRRMKGLGMLALVAVCVAGCQNESLARQTLEKDGYTDITLKKQKDGYEFTAKKGEEDCSGSISVTGFTSNSDTHMFSQCTKPVPECGPEHGEKCFDDGIEADKTDPAAAAVSYQKGCDAKNAKSCLNLGVDYASGTGVPKDPKKAFELFEKACDAKNAQGCNNAGVGYRDGDGTAVDLKKAFDRFQKACAGSDAMGCTSYGAALADGEGCDKDEAKARDAFKKACDGKVANGCADLGISTFKGERGPADKKLGEDLLRKSCDDGSPVGCRALGILAGTKEIADPEGKQASWLEKACSLNDSSACVRLASVDEHGTAGRTKDVSKALSEYEKACTLNDGVGCFDVGIGKSQGWGGQVDMKGAGEAFDKACKLGYAKGCDRAKAFPH